MGEPAHASVNGLGSRVHVCDGTDRGCTVGRVIVIVRAEYD